jgi:hypothetical protein
MILPCKSHLGTGIRNHRASEYSCPRKNHAATGQGRVRRRGVAAGPSKYTLRTEAVDAAVSGEGVRQAGKLLYCVEGGLCFQQASHSLSQPSTSVDREPQRDRGRDRGVETAAEEARWSAPEGPVLIGAGREGVLGASGGRERDCFGGGWLR